MSTEENALRQEIANEVYGESESTIDSEIAEQQVEQEVELPVEPADPWEGVPQTVKNEFESLRTKLAGFEQVDYRLKQAENRIGGLTNELHAAKQAAKTISDAPTQKQIAEASAVSEKWNSLREDFPEWAEATDERIAASRAEILANLPNIDAIRQELALSDDERYNTLRTETLGAVVSVKYPDWETTAATQEFAKWYEETGKQDSWNPIAVIKMLDEWEDYKASKASPKEIIAERKQRLEQSQSRTSNKTLKPAKSEDDMSLDELRASIAATVWGS